MACVTHRKLRHVAGTNLLLLIARSSIANQREGLVVNGLEALLDILSALCLQILGHLDTNLGPTEHKVGATGVK